MQKIYISETQIMRFLKEGLVLLGYPDNIEVHRYIANNKVYYFFKYSDECGNQYLKTFKSEDMINILQNTKIVNGCETMDIGLEVKDGNVNYFVKMNSITSNKKRIKKR